MHTQIVGKPTCKKKRDKKLLETVDHIDIHINITSDIDMCISSFFANPHTNITCDINMDIDICLLVRGYTRLTPTLNPHFVEIFGGC